MAGLNQTFPTKPVVVLSDVHLSANVQSERERAVCAVLALHAGLDVIFLGDLFEFSSAHTLDSARALAKIVEANAHVVTAMRDHTVSGAHIYLVAGNHDAELANLGSVVNELFGPNVSVTPWCVRFGAVHLEHGHLFDRDNAPLHPLAPHNPAHESLGATLMRSVVVDLDARVFAHAHDLTPARALAQGVRTLQFRLPWALARLFTTLVSLVAHSAFGRWGATAAARRNGAQNCKSAFSSGIPELTLQALAAAAPTPTHATLKGLVWRLYLDLVLALLVAGFAAVGFLCGFRALAWVGVLPICYVLAYRFRSVVRGRAFSNPRYHPPLPSLLQGAHTVANLTAASRVVFGHTHVEHDDGVYFNLGSFGYGGSAGRPYAVIAPEGQITRCFVAFDCGQ